MVIIYALHRDISIKQEKKINHSWLSGWDSVPFHIIYSFILLILLTQTSLTFPYSRHTNFLYTIWILLAAISSLWYRVCNKVTVGSPQSSLYTKHRPQNKYLFVIDHKTSFLIWDFEVYQVHDNFLLFIVSIYNKNSTTMGDFYIHTLIETVSHYHKWVTWLWYSPVRGVR